MKEIIEAFAARIKSPVFGYFVLSWVAFNWRPLFYLMISKVIVDERLIYFDKHTSIYSLIVFPFLSAITIAIVYPWFNYVFLSLCQKPSDLRNYIQADSEHKLLIRKQKLEEARSELLATKEKELIGRAKRDEEVKEISDEGTKEKLQEEIDLLRRKIDNDKNSSKSNYSGLHESYKMMSELLKAQGDIPKAKEYLEKAIELEHNRNYK